MKPTYEIVAPVLLCMGDKLIPCESDVFPRWGFRLESRDPLRISTEEPIRSGKSGFHWFVDGNGRLVMLHELERRQRTPEFLKRIFNFTRIYYRMEEPRAITLRELKELAKGRHGLRTSLGKAINQHGIDTIITKEIFINEIMELADPTIILHHPLRYELH